MTTKTATRTSTDTCRHTCPGGQPCTCAAGSHTMHICRDETCQCHSRARYDPAGAAAALQQAILARRNGRK